MISRNLFFNLVRENLKRRTWFIALSFLMFFFLFPVGSALSVGLHLNPAYLPYNMDAQTALSTAKNELFSDFVSWNTPSNGALIFLLFLLAIVAACSGFQYLQSRKKTDFYHSLPIRRSTLFCAVNLNSLLIVVLSYLLMSLSSALIIQFYSGHSGCVGIALRSFLFHCAYFFSGYAFAVLAVMLTGHALICVLAYGVFLFWLPGVIALFGGLASTSFETYCYDPEFFNRLYQYSSPLLLGMEIVSGINRIRLFTELILGVIVLLFAGRLYQIRSSESAEHAMSFRKTEAPIRFLLVIPMALFCAFASVEVLDSTPFSLFSLLCGLIISHCLIEIIYHFDFKRLFSHTPQLAVCGMVSIALFFFFRFDLGAYDRWIPEADKVESVGIFSSSLEPNFNQYHASIRLEQYDSSEKYYPVYDSDHSDLDLTREMSLRAIQPALAIAEQGVAGIRTGQKETDSVPAHIPNVRELETPDQNVEPNVFQGSVLFCWKLKDGRKVMRRYSMDLSAVSAELDQILDDPAYKTAVYPILSETQSEQFIGVNYEDSTGMHHVPIDDPKQIEALLYTYRNEFLALTSRTRRLESPVACLQFKTEEFQGMANLLRKQGESIYPLNQVNYYPVYPSFTDTIRQLKTCGVELNPILSTDMISSLTVQSIRCDSDSDSKIESLEITDPIQIQSILESSKVNLNYDNPLDPAYHGFAIELHFKDNSAVKSLMSYDEADGDIPINLLPEKNKIPAFLNKHFQITKQDLRDCADPSY